MENIQSEGLHWAESEAHQGFKMEQKYRDNILDMGVLVTHLNPGNRNYLALTIVEGVEGITEPSVELDVDRAKALIASLTRFVESR